MPQAGRGATTRSLTLIDELVLTLLNEESGYFRQVPGWNLNCAVVGAALAELSLLSRIDTDMESLILLDGTATGDPTLDTVLDKIAAEPVQRNAQYWIERLAPEAELIIDLILERLVDLKILQYHDGDFWSLSGSAWMTGYHMGSEVGTDVEHVKTRISRTIFHNEIPDPRDVIIVCLIDVCDVLRYIFELDEESEARVKQICKMDLIGRAIADAVGHNIAASLYRPSALAKEIPVVKRRKMLRSEHVRSRNLPALFAELYGEYGPVFQIRRPFMEPLVFVAGPEVNHWVHRNGRMYLRARDYFEDFEKVYGAVGLLPGLDGADHFRYRKSVGSGFSRARLEEQMAPCLAYARNNLATWTVGDTLPGVSMFRALANAQLSPLLVSIPSQDLVDDMHKYKSRALQTHVGRTLPKFMLKTPGMKRRAPLIHDVTDRIQSSHTPAQRAGCPRDLADQMLSLHATDQQFLPQSNLRFVLSTALLASMYAGDQLCFIVHSMVSQPELYARIQDEADALFDGGDPDDDAITGPAIDVTRRFIMECQRLYPTIPASIRNVMNACVVQGYELPEGMRVHIATTATHYLEELFPDPFKFDIERYAAPRKEHLGSGYAPYGLGTHRCLGSGLAELQMIINLLLVAHYFTLEIAPRTTSSRSARSRRCVRTRSLSSQ